MTVTEIEEIKLKIRNAFANIKFEESTHTYTCDGYILESSSAFRSQFEEEFKTDFSALSKYKSNVKKNPSTKKNTEYYKRRWDLIALEAVTMGKRVHAFAETYPDFDEPICNKEKGVVEFFNNLEEEYELIYQELAMYDMEFYKAGTADLIFLNKKTGKIIIGDWKSNNKSIFECYNNKKLKGNFKSYASTSYNKYSMQLSHYQYILEKYTGLEVEDRWLIWLSTGSKKKKESRYKYQKVNPCKKGDYYRVYSCRNFVSKLAKSLEERRVDILKNVKKQSFMETIFNMDELEQLESELERLPQLPQLRYVTNDDAKTNKFKIKK